MWWCRSIQCTTHFLHIYGHQLAIFQRCSYKAITLELRHAMEALANNPFSISLKAEVAQLRKKKQIVDNYATRGAQIKARIHWLKVGDQTSKGVFFGTLCQASKLSEKGINSFLSCLRFCKPLCAITDRFLWPSLPLLCGITLFKSVSALFCVNCLKNKTLFVMSSSLWLMSKR